MFSKYLKKMPGPEIIAQKGSKAKLKNGVLAVIAKGGTEEGHRRKAKKKNGGYGSSILLFKISKPQGEKYPEYLKVETGAQATTDQSTKRQSFLGSGLYGRTRGP